MKFWIISILSLSITASAFANIADFNGDHKVNMADFTILSAAWASQAGEPDYNGDCDIAAEDNVISIADLALFADNWLVNEVILEIYSNGWGHHCQTVLLEDEGTFDFFFRDDQPAYNPEDKWNHYAYASRDGYYTEIQLLETQLVETVPPDGYLYSSTADIDLDPIDPNLFNGTIFLTSVYFVDSYLANRKVEVYSSPIFMGPVLTFITDEQGRFAIDIEPGQYWISFNGEVMGPIGTREREFFVSGNYQDYRYLDMVQAYKPNIYIYPEVKTDLTVKVNFPSGGGIILSEPLYQDKWDVTVEPSGLIDGEYEFLFYESVQPDMGQYDCGWVVEQTELEAFFRKNMTTTGFNNAEIEDFIEYWIPLLIESPYYAIYPQYNEQLKKMIQLDLSVEPQNLIRLIYCIGSLPDDSLSLPEPQIPPSSRDGFTVAEWGVILK